MFKLNNMCLLCYAMLYAMLDVQEVTAAFRTRGLRDGLDMLNAPLNEQTPSHV